MITDPAIVNHLRLSLVLKHAEIGVEQIVLVTYQIFLKFQLVISHSAFARVHGFRNPLINLIGPILIQSEYYLLCLFNCPRHILVIEIN